MKQSLHKLQKFLELEIERGYDNRAVVGGLDRILDSWEMEARADGLTEDLIQAISVRLRDYPRLSETSRKEAIIGLWRRIQREYGEAIPDLKHRQSHLKIKNLTHLKKKKWSLTYLQQRRYLSIPNQFHRRMTPILSLHELKKQTSHLLHLVLPSQCCRISALKLLKPYHA
jgi:hypothetical protein